MVSLFPSSAIYVPDQPEEYGFYELELPDAFWWIKQEATCWLPAESIARLASPVLRITATVGRSERFLAEPAGEPLKRWQARGLGLLEPLVERRQIPPGEQALKPFLEKVVSL